MFCQNCGAKLSENAGFCSNCGTKVYKPESEISQKPTITPGPNIKNTLKSRPSPVTNIMQDDSIAKKKAKKRMIIIGIVGFLILGSFINNMIKGGNDNNNSYSKSRPVKQEQKASVQKKQTEPVNLNKNPNTNLQHGTLVTVKGEVVSGKGTQASRAFSTSWGTSTATPIIINFDNKKDYVVFLKQPVTSSLFEKVITICGYIDETGEDIQAYKTNNSIVISGAVVMK